MTHATRDHVSSVVADWKREQPGLDTAPMEVVSRILRAAHLLQKRLDEIAASHGLGHKGDLDALAALRRAGQPYELSPTELAARLQLTTGGMTNRLDRLEEAGVVVRRPDPYDRRGVLVVLTVAGREVIDEALAASLDAQADALRGLTAEDRSTLASLLEQILLELGDTPVAAG